MAVEAEREAGGASETAGPVDHAVLLLKLLAESAEPLGVNELSRRLGVHQSTASRLLRTLERHHLVRRDTSHGRISLGPGVVALAGPMLGEMDAIAVGRPIVQALAQQTGETVSLGDLERPRGRHRRAGPGDTECRKLHAGKSRCRAFDGGRQDLPGLSPGRGGAPGAGRSLAAADRVHDRGPRRPRWRNQAIRSQGYAINCEENELEACGIAAPVFDYRGEVAIVLNIAIPSFRFKDQKQDLARIVMDSAREL